MVLNGATDLVKRSLVSERRGRSGPGRHGQRDPDSRWSISWSSTCSTISSRARIPAHQHRADRAEPAGADRLHCLPHPEHGDQRAIGAWRTWRPTTTRQNGIFNDLFSVASLLVTENDDGSGHPTIKIPNRNSFMVRNFYADMKRHDLGPEFYERNYDSTLQRQVHDRTVVGCRAARRRTGTTVAASICGKSSCGMVAKHRLHAMRFAAAVREPTGCHHDVPQRAGAVPAGRHRVEPGSGRSQQPPRFPQRGHGSIRLPELFNNPTELE